uniref:Rhodanese domain-containing protein n=1 Tax=Haptolina ericina TaxID=156174 RepID=A0A7S3B9N9_9EUKA
MRNVLRQYEGTSGPNARNKKRDEFFQRLRPSTLGKLLEPALESEESVYRLGHEDTASVVSVVDSTATTEAEGNLLIYDLRSFERFNECHIFGAKQYDPRELSKATNNFPRDVYFYKGPVEGGKMIVLYDEDGKTAPAVGNAFVEKGIENTYVLNGGFLGACAGCPAMLMGQPPSPDDLAAMMQIAGLKMASSGVSVCGRSVPGTAASVSGASQCSSRTQQTSLSGFGPTVGASPRPWK